MKSVNVPADVLVALIRVYKLAHGTDRMDPEAAKLFPVVHRLEVTATRKLKESRHE